MTNKMTDPEIIAKAMKIAIALTGANDTWLTMDDHGHISMKEPLFSTIKKVIRIMHNTGDLIDTRGDCRVFPVE